MLQSSLGYAGLLPEGEGGVKTAVLFPEMALLAAETRFSGPLNMAVDEVLLQSATGPLLRIYGWAELTVSCGYFTPWQEAMEHSAPGPRVRRWTGGGIVPHGEDFTYTLIVPRGGALAELPAAESYAGIHAAVAQALECAGGQATQLATAAAPVVSRACFENPAAADVLVAGQKVAGGAQRRTRWGLLHQGSIQLPAGVRDFQPYLVAALAENVVAAEFTPAQLAEAEALAAQKYATTAWQQRF